MALSGDQFEELVDTLVNAFTMRELDILARKTLEKSLDAVAIGNQTDCTHQLVAAVERADKDKFRELLNHAVILNSDNLRLRRLYDRYRASSGWEEYLKKAIAGGKRSESDRSSPYLNLLVQGVYPHQVYDVDTLLTAFISDRQARVLIVRGKAGSGKSRLLNRWFLQQAERANQVYPTNDSNNPIVPTPMALKPEEDVPILADLRNYTGTNDQDFEQFLVTNLRAVGFLLVDSPPALGYTLPENLHNTDVHFVALLDALDEMLLTEAHIHERITCLHNAVRNHELPIKKWIISVRSEMSHAVPRVVAGLPQVTWWDVRINDLYVDENLLKTYYEREDDPLSQEQARVFAKILSNDALRHFAGRPMWLGAMTGYLRDEWWPRALQPSATDVSIASILHTSLEEILLREAERQNLERHATAKVWLGLSNLAYNMERHLPARERCTSQELESAVSNALVPRQVGIMVEAEALSIVKFSEPLLQRFFCSDHLATDLSVRMNRTPQSLATEDMLIRNAPKRAGMIWAFLIDLLAETPDVASTVKAQLFQPQHWQQVTQSVFYTPMSAWRDPANRAALLTVLRDVADKDDPSYRVAWHELTHFIEDVDLLTELFATAKEQSLFGLNAAWHHLANAPITLLSLSNLQEHVPRNAILLLQTVYSYLESDPNIEPIELLERCQQRWPHLLYAAQVADSIVSLDLLNYVIAWAGIESSEVDEVCRILGDRFVTDSAVMSQICQILQDRGETDAATLRRFCEPQLPEIEEQAVQGITPDPPIDALAIQVESELDAADASSDVEWQAPILQSGANNDSSEGTA